MVLQVQPPVRCPVATAVRCHHDDVGAVSEAHQRRCPTPARPATHGREDGDLAAPPSPADPTPGGPVDSDVHSGHRHGHRSDTPGVARLFHLSHSGSRAANPTGLAVHQLIGGLDKSPANGDTLAVPFASWALGLELGAILALCSSALLLLRSSASPVPTATSADRSRSPAVRSTTRWLHLPRLRGTEMRAALTSRSAHRLWPPAVPAQRPGPRGAAESALPRRGLRPHRRRLLEHGRRRRRPGRSGRR